MGSIWQQEWIIDKIDSRLVGGSMFNFGVQSQLQDTPAGSRAENRECYLEGFYDYHDVWHFFSACGMFFAFLVSTLS